MRSAVAAATQAPVSLRYRCAAALSRAFGCLGLRSASAKARLAAALSPIVWVYSMTRTAAPCTLAITKSVSVRPCSSARWNSAFWSRETRASSRSSRTLAMVFPDMPHYTLSCIQNLASIYG